MGRIGFQRSRSNKILLDYACAKSRVNTLPYFLQNIFTVLMVTLSMVPGYYRHNNKSK